MRVVLFSPHGTLALNGDTGLTFTEGTHSGSSRVAFTGALPDINSALNGLIFTPNAGYQGWSELFISTSDLGHNGLGEGGFASDFDKVDITVRHAAESAHKLGSFDRRAAFRHHYGPDPHHFRHCARQPYFRIGP